MPDPDFRRKILDEGPMTVARVPMVFKQWHHSLVLKKELQSSVPVWIRLKNIPYPYWSAPGISEIASGVDRPLYVDPLTEQMRRLSFARVCVEISAKLERCDSMEVFIDDESFIVPIIYEWRPDSCPKGCTFGHNCVDRQGDAPTAEGTRDPVANPVSAPRESPTPVAVGGDQLGWKQVTHKKKK